MHHQAILLITDNLKEYIDNLETIYLQHRGVVESVEEFSPRTNITKMLQTAKDAAVLKEKLTNTITLIESHCDLFHLLIAGAGAEERSSLNERFQALRLKTTTEHSLLNRRALTQQALLWRDDIEKVEDKIITHLSLKDRVRCSRSPDQYPEALRRIVRQKLVLYRRHGSSSRTYRRFSRFVSKAIKSWRSEIEARSRAEPRSLHRLIARRTKPSLEVPPLLITDTDSATIYSGDAEKSEAFASVFKKSFTV
ncbi:hypothetical protein QR680_009240 [Steinernema hermaphroditum]|uniref:Uncharacterized protein n=1 Tax=Steinernema hermaphroditum TaxID=289476 RepID=A0AA39IJJ0_9BILA|nr:hypothetical protein QR680_009240 [Steinernema hermaphroditum]